MRTRSTLFRSKGGSPERALLHGMTLRMKRRFCKLVKDRSGHPFRSFDASLAAVWESYKPRPRDHALRMMRFGDNRVEDEMAPSRSWAGRLKPEFS